MASSTTLMKWTLVAIATLLMAVNVLSLDPCMRKPSIDGLCISSTVGIYFDAETQRCKYMGCSKKKLFATLKDCEKICNNKRHRERRLQKPKT